jgi:hypothetical protein
MSPLGHRRFPHCPRPGSRWRKQCGCLGCRSPGWGVGVRRWERGVVDGSHLVIHEPVRYLDWTWRDGTGDYTGLAGSGKAEFMAPNLEQYGVLGRLSGTIRDAQPASQSPSQR